LQDRTQNKGLFCANRLVLTYLYVHILYHDISRSQEATSHAGRWPDNTKPHDQHGHRVSKPRPYPVTCTGTRRIRHYSGARRLHRKRRELVIRGQHGIEQSDNPPGWLSSCLDFWISGEALCPILHRKRRCYTEILLPTFTERDRVWHRHDGYGLGCLAGFRVHHSSFFHVPPFQQCSHVWGRQAQRTLGLPTAGQLLWQ
jgi:hypothetical protein